MSDGSAYQVYLRQKADSYEAECRRCGACCGLEEADPCSRLLKDDNGQYYCSVYESRLGLQMTVSGREFNCVPLRTILFEPWPGSWKCNYR